MGLTNKQKMLLHIAPARLGIDESQRRVIQRNIGGFYSAADRAASHAGFAAVMAYYEQRAGGRLEGYTPGYWQAAHDRNERGESTERLIWRIRRLAGPGGLGMSGRQIDEFLAGPHMTNGQFNHLEEAPAYWLRKCLQGIIEIRKRQVA